MDFWSPSLGGLLEVWAAGAVGSGSAEALATTLESGREFGGAWNLRYCWNFGLLVETFYGCGSGLIQGNQNGQPCGTSRPLRWLPTNCFHRSLNSLSLLQCSFGSFWHLVIGFWDGKGGRGMTCGGSGSSSTVLATGTAESTLRHEPRKSDNSDARNLVMERKCA